MAFIQACKNMVESYEDPFRHDPDVMDFATGVLRCIAGTLTIVPTAMYLIGKGRNAWEERQVVHVIDGARNSAHDSIDGVAGQTLLGATPPFNLEPWRAGLDDHELQDFNQTVKQLQQELGNDHFYTLCREIADSEYPTENKDKATILLLCSKGMSAWHVTSAIRTLRLTAKGNSDAILALRQIAFTPNDGTAFRNWGYYLDTNNPGPTMHLAALGPYIADTSYKVVQRALKLCEGMALESAAEAQAVVGLAKGGLSKDRIAQPHRQMLVQKLVENPNARAEDVAQAVITVSEIVDYFRARPLCENLPAAYPEMWIGALEDLLIQNPELAPKLQRIWEIADELGIIGDARQMFEDLIFWLKKPDYGTLAADRFIRLMEGVLPWMVSEPVRRAAVLDLENAIPFLNEKKLPNFTENLLRLHTPSLYLTYLGYDDSCYRLPEVIDRMKSEYKDGRFVIGTGKQTFSMPKEASAELQQALSQHPVVIGSQEEFDRLLGLDLKGIDPNTAVAVIKIAQKHKGLTANFLNALLKDASSSPNESSSSSQAQTATQAVPAEILEALFEVNFALPDKDAALLLEQLSKVEEKDRVTLIARLNELKEQMKDDFSLQVICGSELGATLILDAIDALRPLVFSKNTINIIDQVLRTGRFNLIPGGYDTDLVTRVKRLWLVPIRYWKQVEAARHLHQAVEASDVDAGKYITPENAYTWAKTYWGDVQGSKTAKRCRLALQVLCEQHAPEEISKEMKDALPLAVYGLALREGWTEDDSKAYKEELLGERIKNFCSTGPKMWRGEVQ